MEVDGTPKGQSQFAGCISFEFKYEGAAIRAAAAPGVPVALGDGAYAAIVPGHALECGIDRLFLRSYQAHLDVAAAQRKDLRPQH